MAKICFRKGGIDLKISCEIVLDLIPLVKDNVASESSTYLVLEHLESCDECKIEFDSYKLKTHSEVDDTRVLSTMKKKLFLITSSLLILGTFIGLVLNKTTPLNSLSIIIMILSITIAGILIFKPNLKEEESMRRFFLGKAIGTFIVFVILGVYLLLRYVFHL